MRITIVFGGLNSERLVSVASAQALHSALPEADLWFWDVGDTVHEVLPQTLEKHSRPFEQPFKPGNPGIGGIEQALDKAKSESRLLVLGLHGGMAENGELQAMCDAKPVRDGSSYGLIFVNSTQDLVAVRRAANTEDYLIEPFITGAEATCCVLEQLDGSIVPLPPVEIIPAEDGFGFDYRAKYLAKSTQEICPARFAPELNAQIMDQAVRAHTALSCRGYSRSDFIVSEKGPIFLETNTLPGLTKASLYPKALHAQGIEFTDFLKLQIALAEKAHQTHLPNPKS